MSDLVGIIFLIGLAVVIVLSTVQILRDRKKSTHLAGEGAASLDASLPLPIDITDEGSSIPQPGCAPHDVGHSDFGGDHGCGDFGGGHHH
jgi:hypothetical protein